MDIKSKNFQKVLGVVAVVVLLWGSTKADRGASARKYQKKNSKIRKSNGGLVDKQFFDRIKKLLAIAIPNYTCKEFKYVIILTLLLILRT